MKKVAAGKTQAAGKSGGRDGAHYPPASRVGNLGTRELYSINDRACPNPCRVP